MKKALISELSKMNETDFYLLEHHLRVARWIRDLKEEFKLTNYELAKNLNISIAAVNKVLNGAYPFDLAFVATYQSYHAELRKIKAINDTRLKVEAKSIGLPEYKYSIPLWLQEKFDQLTQEIRSVKNSNASPK